MLVQVNNIQLIIFKKFFFFYKALSANYISFDNPFPSPTTHTAAAQPRGKREREEEMTELERQIQEREEKLQKLRAKKVLQSKMQENDEHALEGNNY